jgi:hypothetical protein
MEPLACAPCALNVNQRSLYHGCCAGREPAPRLPDFAFVSWGRRWLRSATGFSLCSILLGCVAIETNVIPFLCESARGSGATQSIHEVHRLLFGVGGHHRMRNNF